MQRTALDVMKIAAQAKTKSSNFEAGKYQRPADFNKLVSIITVMNLKGECRKKDHRRQFGVRACRTTLRCGGRCRQPGNRGRLGPARGIAGPR